MVTGGSLGLDIDARMKMITPYLSKISREVHWDFYRRFKGGTILSAGMKHKELY
jgi:hypothetical protein